MLARRNIPSPPGLYGRFGDPLTLLFRDPRTWIGPTGTASGEYAVQRLEQALEAPPLETIAMHRAGFFFLPESRG